jgi:hypothetical protein
MRSEAWQQRRLEIIERDGGRCRTCGKPGNHVHHVTYDRLGQEPPRDLVLLCKSCHELEHALYKLKYRQAFWHRQNDLLALGSIRPGHQQIDSAEVRTSAGTAAIPRSRSLSSRGSNPHSGEVVRGGDSSAQRAESDMARPTDR